MADGPLLPVVQPGRQPARPSVFDRIAIVGLGPLGAAVGLAARQAFPSALVIGVDRNDRLETCVRLGAIDIGAGDPIVVAEAELILLALPRAEQERWLGAVAEWMRVAVCAEEDAAAACRALLVPATTAWASRVEATLSLGLAEAARWKASWALAGLPWAR